MKKTLQFMLRMNKDQARLSALLSVAISLNVVIARILVSQYQGYGRNVFADIARPTGDKILVALSSLPSGVSYALIGHPMDYYPYAVIILGVMFWPAFRERLSDVIGRVAFIALCAACFLGFGHFVRYSGEWQQGYWSGSLVNTGLLILSVPSLLYFSQVAVVTLIQCDNGQMVGAFDRYRKHRWKVFAATTLAMIGLKNLFDVLAILHFGLLFTALVSLLVSAVLCSLLFFFFRWLQGSDRSPGNDGSISTTVATAMGVQVAGHMVRLVALNDWSPNTGFGQFLYWFVFYGLFTFFSLYTYVVIANGISLNSRHVA